MFIETHSYKDGILAFIKSTNIQAYPCGHRRSELVDKDGESSTNNDQYYFPFDPEARLNTEANNRKHSSLNGYTQTYLKDWDKNNKLLTLALAGYLFNISLSDSYIVTNSGYYEFKANDFGTDIISVLQARAEADLSTAQEKGIEEDIDNASKKLEAITAATKIYANILLEDVNLFSGFQKYKTSVLRNQSATLDGSIDLLKSSVNQLDLNEIGNFNNYYFSGLSFSTTPLTGDPDLTKTYSYVEAVDSTTKVRQTVVSLCILKKKEGTWEIYEPAKLPKIEHGETEDSIVVTGDALMKSSLTVNDKANINEASINKASINEAKITTKTTIEGELVVKNDDPAKASLDNALITGVLVVTNPERNPDNPNYDPDADPAEIVADFAGIEDISASTINASDIQQKIGDGDDYYDVPVIFLAPKTEDNKTTYQLQISRVNLKN